MRYRQRDFKGAARYWGLVFCIVGFSLSAGSVLRAWGCPEEHSRWVMAPVTNVDLNEEWVVSSRGPILMFARATTSAPQETDEIELDDDIVDLALAGHLTYVLTARDQLIVVDLSAPPDSGVLSRFELNSVSSAMAVDHEAQWLYVGNDTGLSIVDISQPSELNLLAQIDLPSAVMNVVVSGDFVYAVSKGGFSILRISGSLEVEEVGQWTGYFDDITVDGDYAFLSGHQTMLRVVSLSDPTEPVTVASIQGTGSYVSIAIVGNVAVVANRSDSTVCSVIDISNPETPEIIGEMSWLAYAFEVASSGDYCALGVANGLLYLDLTFPPRPYPLWSIDPQWLLDSLAAEDGRVFAATDQGVQILDISEEGKITMGSLIPQPEWLYEMVVENGLLVGRTWDEGLVFFDVSDADSPSKVATWRTWWDIQDMEIRGRDLFVAAGWDGLKIFDVSDPTSIHTRGGVEVSGYAANVAVADATAAVSDNNRNLSLIDISDPQNPVIRGLLPAAGSRIIGREDYFYLNAYNRIRIVDAGDPENPRIVADVTMSDRILSFGLVGRQLWCLLADDSIELIDVGNPLTPRLVSRVERNYVGDDIAVAEDFVAVNSGGVRIFESEPCFPEPRLSQGRSSP
ncbi:MAG: hypothetical protein K8R59_14980 [Thermoanaerobaculales bacterium]|nr:hypothetical protein [Thermoanaerobaculales bacterium]